MRKFRRSRRAVSAVLGSVLLVLAVVLGMSLAFAFFVDYVGDYQRGRGSSVMELVEIEDVHFIDGGMVVWLYNYGEIEVEVDAIYVNGLLVFDSDSSVEILPSEHVKVDVSSDWVPGGSYVFRVVTLRGSATERGYVAPRV